MCEYCKKHHHDDWYKYDWKDVKRDYYRRDCYDDCCRKKHGDHHKKFFKCICFFDDHRKYD
ncbi:hypothetical protein [Bacillus sp. T33-2]|uniref:hypothetical protein n=1 Tax=Bacillus sp. T33-2 TaxID=2054168 RepID=UPI001159F5EF|nr:hypothetical protein [Bacillus sp. T33-2]